MGIFDRSSSTTNQSLVDQTTTTTTQTDQGGALVALSDLAGAFGLDFSSKDSHDARYENSGNTHTTTLLSDANAIAAGRELGLAGVGSASRAVDTLANSYGESLTVLERVNADSLELLGGLVSSSLDSSRTLARDAVAGFSSLASKSTEGESDKISRVVGFALAAVAAVIVLPAIFKGGGAKAVI